ncbi:MAG TPA: type II secretion system protein GspG [Fibrobacteria bacterium]|nr:type II secretion system protein GspG [Fibrobacteria bacterium]
MKNSFGNSKRRDSWLPYRLIGLIFASLHIVGCVSRIPANSLTATRMFILENRIQEFYVSTGKVPVALNDLPQKVGIDNKTVDGWGRQFLFSSDSLGQLTLLSLGRDGITGGTEQDADIIGVFTITSKKSTNAVRNSNWVIEPSVRK